MARLPTHDQPARKASQLRQKAKVLRKQAEELETSARSLVAPIESQEAAKSIAARKGDIAVFLGAGASKTFGWPLTNELLPIILEGLIDEDLFEDRRINDASKNAEDRNLLQETLRALCPGLELTKNFLKENRLRLPLVTSLLSMLDFSLSSSQALVSKLTPERVRDARMLLERAIYEAIEHQEVEQGANYWPPRKANQLTTQLVTWLDDVRAEQTKIGVITSNYDVAIEKAWGFDDDNQLAVKNLAIDFGFDWTWPSNSFPPTVIARPENPKRRLYKLHGSTNWLRCGLCDRMYINPEVGIAIYAYDRKARPNNACHCGHAKLEVQIVSPSFVRDMRAPNLASVWQRALNWLRRADDWVVIGYSFPDEDLNIRALFTRALASRATPPHVTAIQFGTNEQTQMRYEAFFPPGRLTFLTGGLKVFLKNLA